VAFLSLQLGHMPTLDRIRKMDGEGMEEKKYKKEKQT
jgi:hypothetical protein